MVGEGEPTGKTFPPPVEDGLTTRDAGAWVKDKLGILSKYFPAFGRACSGKAGRWYYADAFAGSGVNRIRDTGELVWGSAPLALQAEPSFTRCLLLERGGPEVRALEARTIAFGDRAVVRRGDCNVDLLPRMRESLDARFPCLCLLDPEGMEVNWATIQALSTFRGGKYKVELLILFTPDGVGRVMPLYTVEPWAEPGLLRFWGHEAWKAVHERRVAGKVSGDEARTEYVALYVQGLRELGYETVLNREIRREGRLGGVKYFLIFASDNPAGKKIMDWCFRHVFPREEQGFLPGFEPATTRDV